jgi:HKD family nuclease
MDEYEHYSWAVAWASSANPLFHKLLKHRDRIERLVVGTQLYQTHPDFMAQFIGDESVHFVLKTSGIFHPKVYLFESNQRWACVIGSANFTEPAFRENQEMCILVDSSNENADRLYQDVRQAIFSYWSEARC